MTTLLTRARAGELDPALDRMMRLARDARGRDGDGSGYPTIRAIKRWMKNPVPKAKRQRAVPAWGAAFLAYYGQPQKPTVEAAYRRACAENAFGAETPSIYQVRRFLDMLGTVTRERGRMGEREIKNILPFVRRSFEHLQANDIWTGDGHTFDSEVQHPLHGRPFRPEITTFLDIATRRVVAWSVGLAESSWAVADALRWGVEQNGVPAMLYVDNGSGYRNAFMSDEATGLCSRLGVQIEHSLPYNSQARGIIERSHQTIWVRGAKLLPAYMGAAMDRQARLEQFKVTRRALKSGGVMPLMPWDLFIAFCKKLIDEYNAQAHRSLGGVSPDLSLANFRAKGWEPVTVAADEIDTLFRPRTVRKVARGEINLFNNLYFSTALTEFHGDEVHVAYDIHDPAKVWVYDLDGRLITTADVNGNRKHYYPVAVVEQAREKRAAGRLARVEAKADEIRAELLGAPAFDAHKQVVIAGRVMDLDALPREAERLAAEREAVAAAVPPQMPRIEPKPRPAPVPSRSERSASDNYAEWLALDTRLANGETVSDDDARWHRMYPTSAQFKAHVKKMATHRAA